MTSLRPLRGRSSTFSLLIGVAVGLLVAAMVVPYVRVQTQRVAAVAPASSGSAAGPAAAQGDSGSSAPGSSAGQPAATGARGRSAPGGGGGSGTTQPPVLAPSSPVAGVTSSEIKLGIGIISVGAAKQFGFSFDIGNEQARYQALIDKVNGSGGVNGRKIVPYFETFDATNPTVPSQAACIAWTRDDKVFSVLVESQFPTAAEVCIIAQGHTPLLTTQGTEASYYANNLLFTTLPSDNRTLIDQAHFLAANGSLQGKTIGVVTGDGSDQLAVDNSLVPTLKQLGYAVKDVEVVPGSTAGTQRLPIAISNLKAAGVNFVIIAANVILAGPFVQAANHAGYNPKYGLSDFNNEINDQVANYYPASFQGTVGLSTQRFPEYRAGGPFTATDQACLNVVHPVDPKVLPPTNAAFPVAMGDCAIFNAWLEGVTRAGPALNQASFLTAMDQSGTFGIPGVQNGSFGAGKHDADDYEQAVAWQQSCTCWELVDGLSTPVRQLQS